LYASGAAPQTKAAFIFLSFFFLIIYRRFVVDGEIGHDEAYPITVYFHREKG